MEAGEETSRKRKREEGRKGAEETFGEIMKCVNAADVISMSNKEIRALVMVRELCNSVANKDRKLPTDGDVSRALKNGTKYGVEVCKSIGDQLGTVGFEGFNEEETRTLERILKTARVIVELGGTRRRPKLEGSAKEVRDLELDEEEEEDDSRVALKTEIVEVDPGENSRNAGIGISLLMAD